MKINIVYQCLRMPEITALRSALSPWRGLLNLAFCLGLPFSALLPQDRFQEDPLEPSLLGGKLSSSKSPVDLDSEACQLALSSLFPDQGSRFPGLTRQEIDRYLFEASADAKKLIAFALGASDSMPRLKDPRQQPGSRPANPFQDVNYHRFMAAFADIGLDWLMTEHTPGIEFPHRTPYISELAGIRESPQGPLLFIANSISGTHHRFQIRTTLPLLKFAPRYQTPRVLLVETRSYSRPPPSALMTQATEIHVGKSALDLTQAILKSQKVLNRKKTIQLAGAYHFSRYGLFEESQSLVWLHEILKDADELVIRLPLSLNFIESISKEREVIFTFDEPSPSAARVSLYTAYDFHMDSESRAEFATRVGLGFIQEPKLRARHFETRIDLPDGAFEVRFQVPDSDKILTLRFD